MSAAFVGKLTLLTNIYYNIQINHSSSITTEDYAYEIKGAGLFSRDLIFSLRSPVPVKAGEQVKYVGFYEAVSVYHTKIEC